MDKYKAWAYKVFRDYFKEAELNEFVTFLNVSKLFIIVKKLLLRLL